MLKLIYPSVDVPNSLLQVLHLCLLTLLPSTRDVLHSVAKVIAEVLAFNLIDYFYLPVRVPCRVVDRIVHFIHNKPQCNVDTTDDTI